MHFLDLPSEISHIIYSHFFASQLVTITTGEALDAGTIHDRVEVTGWDDLLPLLLTCKQIYHSAGPYLRKATVRVDMISHYYAKLVHYQSRPHVTRRLVPAIEHVWNCISRLTAPEQTEAVPPSLASASLPNFQLCLYDCFDHWEYTPASANPDTYHQEQAKLRSLAVAGRYDESSIQTCATTASQILARLRPSMPDVGFAEILVVFDLETYYRDLSLSVDDVRTELVSRKTGLILSVH